MPVWTFHPLRADLSVRAKLHWHSWQCSEDSWDDAPERCWARGPVEHGAAAAAAARQAIGYLAGDGACDCFRGNASAGANTDNLDTGRRSKRNKTNCACGGNLSFYAVGLVNSTRWPCSLDSSMPAASVHANTSPAPATQITPSSRKGEGGEAEGRDYVHAHVECLKMTGQEVTELAQAHLAHSAKPLTGNMFIKLNEMESPGSAPASVSAWRGNVSCNVLGESAPPVTVREPLSSLHIRAEEPCTNHTLQNIGITPGLGRPRD
jgi:hypothetical protein